MTEANRAVSARKKGKRVYNALCREVRMEIPADNSGRHHLDRAEMDSAFLRAHLRTASWKSAESLWAKHPPAAPMKETAKREGPVVGFGRSEGPNELRARAGAAIRRSLWL